MLIGAPPASFLYELDLLGRIVAVNDSNGHQVNYAYDARGNQTGITYPDGSQAVYQYECAQQRV